MVAATTGYRYGCRCPRCTEAHKAALKLQRATTCADPSCNEPRLKHRRTCAEHTRPVQAEPKQTKKLTRDCELCGRSHTWYESQLVATVRANVIDLYRRTCNGCRQRYIGVIKAHRLDTETAIRLILAEACDLCGCRFSIAATGRRNVHIDHDHFCCPGAASCGSCVRGFLCPRCNHVIASLEGVRDVGLDLALAYLARAEANELQQSAA